MYMHISINKDSKNLCVGMCRPTITVTETNVVKLKKKIKKKEKRR